MNFAIWNVRGLNKSPHQQEVKIFIISNNLSFMCCVETKVSIDNAVAVSRKTTISWSWIFNFEYHDNGRIFVGWDPSIWHISVHSKSAQHVTCFVTFIKTQVHFCVSFIYAYNKPHQRVALWDDLRQLSQCISVM